ncbi:MAG: hypothetical protein CL840_08205 [Crocinitomicaceae bacterium]|nr:hypothetical protein [Crocinitomicaceae bacterium]|tara:strand:- start:32790 stop:33698 length:909 start_codon:yes stop_codon:yes gene_type:complete
MTYRFITIITLAISVLAIWSCDSEAPEKTQDSIEESLPDELNISRSDKVQYQRAKIVLFSLPSPMETAKVLKKSGAIYDSKYLNPVENLDKHETSKGRAIVMGIYVADLSYANVFKQQQACMDYFAAMSELANELSLSEVFTKEFIEKVDENISNEDSVLKYLTESYWRANNELKEDDRESVAGLIAAGGWIEGLYIATHLINPQNMDDPVTERIAEQGATLKQLIKFLSSFRDDKNLLDIIKDLEKLEKLFDKIEVEKVRVEASTDENGVAVVGKKKVYKFKGTLLQDIIDQTKDIRNKYV